MQNNIVLTDDDFACICQLVNEYSGISLTESKRDMVYGRLSRRLRQLGIDRFDKYCELLRNGGTDERVQFVNAITTNLTSFFREKHHFDYLGRTVIPSLISEKASNRRLRIWSAGCSSGEEPYSIAITVRENLPRSEEWDVRILATDIDSNMVEKADSGVYSYDRIKGIDHDKARSWFWKGRGENGGLIKVIDELRDMVTFRTLNLMHEWPMQGPFDVIFCRNVVIYFSKETQKILFDRMANIMKNGGHLFIGHSESLFNVTDRFKGLGNTIYQKLK